MKIYMAAFPLICSLSQLAFAESPAPVSFDPGGTVEAACGNDDSATTMLKKVSATIGHPVQLYKSYRGTYDFREIVNPKVEYALQQQAMQRMSKYSDSCYGAVGEYMRYANLSTALRDAIQRGFRDKDIGFHAVPGAPTGKSLGELYQKCTTVSDILQAASSRAGRELVFRSDTAENISNWAKQKWLNSRRAGTCDDIRSIDNAAIQGLIDADKYFRESAKSLGYSVP